MAEADGRRILFDTGARPGTWVKNAKELGIDLSGIKDVVLSHNHGDHTVGLSSIRSQVAGAQVHAGKGIFYSRPGPRGEGNHLVSSRARLEGLNFVEHDKPVELAPGVWLTGPVPRKYPERNYPGSGKVVTPEGVRPEGVREDTVPEDASLVFDTDEGLVCRLAAMQVSRIRSNTQGRSSAMPRYTRRSAVGICSTGQSKAGAGSSTLIPATTVSPQ